MTQIELLKEFILTVIVLAAGAFALYQVKNVTKKHAIKKLFVAVYGVFFVCMIVRLFSLIIIANY